MTTCRRIQKFDHLSKNPEIRPPVENLSGEKILGITWDENEDFLIISFEDIDENTNNIKITKRIILKVVSSCFNPVGWIQPIIVQLKIIFQESCKLGFDWDDEISPELDKKWFITIKEIKKSSPHKNQIVISLVYIKYFEND